MLRGFYSAASGMYAQQRRTEMLTNNIANANTPGFKADQSSLRAFPEMLLQRMEATSTQNPRKGFLTTTQIGSMNSGVYLQEATSLFKQGGIRETGVKTDLALIDGVLPIDPTTNKKGALFFTVQNNAGELRYTRNGNFTQDASGYLTTNEGFYVLDTTGNPIQLTSNNFSISSKGEVIEDGSIKAKLNIALSNNPNNMVKEGSGLFRSDEGLVSANDAPNVSFTLQQGFLEQSNVDVAQAMTEMMTAYRAFEANQKILQAYDKSMDKAVNEIGRLR
ncbi:flagellar hook-basal body protein [Bacillus timonensis]|nr:flagellar hook-basal body protein [Bacillus timonensis]